MSAATFSAGTYPIRLNKRESKVVETAQSMGIVVTAADTTTDFAALKVGQICVKIADTAGNPEYGVVVTAGTCPFTPAVDDLVIVMNAK
jgi:hypothetical protein